MPEQGSRSEGTGAAGRNPRGGSRAANAGGGDDVCPVRVLHPEALARAQATMRPDETYGDLAETFRALGDASRARILHALLGEELCVCDLAALVGSSESAVSQHLRVLRGLRIVRSRKAGRVVYYALEDACIRALLTIALTHLDDPRGDGEAAGSTLGQGQEAPRWRGLAHVHRHSAPPGDGVGEVRHTEAGR
jgi:ArsR family transcriptional regulator, lead/cadmium/zinc/bismuth-responsive transcriptional repressor